MLFELTNSEDHPAYQALEIAYAERHYSLLESIVAASLQMARPFLSQTVVKALNYHAIACLHTNAGEYRPCPVTAGDYRPPQHHRVPALMDELVNFVNLSWRDADAVVLASYVLWRLNNIHPFISGNGRTAGGVLFRSVCQDQNFMRTEAPKCES